MEKNDYVKNPDTFKEHKIDVFRRLCFSKLPSPFITNGNIRAVNNIEKENQNNLTLLFFMAGNGLWRQAWRISAIIFGCFRHIWRKFNGGFRRAGVRDLAQILKI